MRTTISTLLLAMMMAVYASAQESAPIPSGTSPAQATQPAPAQPAQQSQSSPTPAAAGTAQP